MTDTGVKREGRAQPFSAATLHEAAGGIGALPPYLKPVWAGASLYGPAFTVRQGPGDNLWLHRAVYHAPPGSVLVVETGDCRYGYWGELMTRAALQRGLHGLVIDGGVRDVDAIEALSFPVFASAVCLQGTTKNGDSPGSIGDPIRLGDTQIRSGDVIVGDRDGVVALPSAEMKRIMARAGDREVWESGIREALAEDKQLVDLISPDALTNDAKPSSPVDRLLRIGTCTLSDALDLLGMEGALTGFRGWGPRRAMAGRVTTVAVAAGPGPTGGSHLGTRALADAGPGDVVVVSNPGHLEAGSWGGLLTLQAHVRGVSGIVVDGALRDADEVDALDVPVMARSTTPRSARGRFHEVATNVPVTIGPVRMEPGAWVLADGSGVVFIEEDRLEQVLAVAEEMQAQELDIVNGLRDGAAAHDLMGREYDAMLERSGDG